MLYIFNLLILIMLSFSLIYITKRRFEEVFSLGVFFVILILYLFSLFALVDFGIYIVLILTVVLFLGTLIAAAVHKKYKEILYNLFTPGFIIFILLSAAIGYMTEDRLLGRWDEFTNWGLQLKNMFIFHGLANVEGVTTLGTGYPPATTVFEYFFSGFRKELVEGDMFRAMGILTVSVVLPVFKKFQWKKSIQAVLTAFLVFLLPAIFSKDMDYLNTLYVDALMGLLLAMILYIYFSEKFSKYSFIMIGMGAFVLSLVKSTGFPLAMVALVIIAFDVLFFKRKDLKGYRIPFILIFVIGLSGKITWWLFVKLTSLKEIWSDVDVSSIESQGIFTETRVKIIKNFIRTFFSGKDTSVEGISPFMWIIICAIIMIFIFLILRNKKKIKRAGLNFILLVLGYLAYASSLMAMYLFLFIEYEGLSLASFGRYIDTFILAMLMFLVYIFIDLLSSFSKTSFTVIVLCVFTIMALRMPFDYIKENTIDSHKYIEENNNKRATYSKVAGFNDFMNYKDERIYFISQKTRGLDYAISYYEATPVRLGYDFYMGWSLGEPYYEGDIWTLDFSLEKWEKILKEDYTYVYLYKIDDKFKERYGSLFEDKIDDDTLYIINVENGKVILRKTL